MDTISRYIVSCDIAWYWIWYHNVSRYIMRYHTGSPRNTRQIDIQLRPNSSSRSTPVFFGFVSAIILASPPAGLFLRPSHVHQLDTSQDCPYEQTATLSPRDSACSLSAWLLFLFIFFLYYFFSLSLCVFPPGRPRASNWCEFMEPNSIIRSTQAARRFRRAVCILMLLFQA